jgi:hypothetical protein
VYFVLGSRKRTIANAENPARSARRAVARWRIVPCRPPHLVRRCSGCGVTRQFASTGAFRLNANKRRLDVWLLYRCLSCEDTWKARVFDRAPVTGVPPSELEAMLRNDPDHAWRCATDEAWLSRLPVEVERDVPVRVDRDDDAPPHDAIALELTAPVSMRLDRLLARELCLTRSELARRIDRGEITIAPDGASALRRPARDGAVIRVLASGSDRRAAPSIS